MQWLADRLSDKQAIERITMMHGQARCQSGVLRSNRKLVEAAADCRAGNLCCIGDKIAAPQLRLDRDLPDTCCRKQDLVRWIEDRLPCLGRQFCGFAESPEKNVRVQQHAHQRPSKPAMTFAGSGASKSSGILILPFRIPSLRTRFVATRGTSLATGLPAFAITTSLPAAARSTSFDSCVLASCMLTKSRAMILIRVDLAKSSPIGEPRQDRKSVV